MQNSLRLRTDKVVAELHDRLKEDVNEAHRLDEGLNVPLKERLGQRLSQSQGK